MSNRLSEDAVIASWDAGQALAVTNTPLLSLTPHIDLNQLLGLEEPEAAVQALDRRDLYLAIVNAGPEDAIEIMQYLSAEQFVAILDYEAWQNEHLSIYKAMRWLELYKHFGVDKMFQRFKDLDEEYQTGLLCPYVEVVDEEGYEALGHDAQDQYRALPCHTLWYRLKHNDQKIDEFVSALVEGGLGEDLNYTYSLLAHATYLPPNEQEELMRQFRRSRIEEDGFITPEQSLELFSKFDGQSLFDRWRAKSEALESGEALTTKWIGAESFLEAVLSHIQSSAQYDVEATENLQRSFAVLANMLASAFRIEADEVPQLTRLFEQSRGLVSLGLEILADGRVDVGADVLFSERPKTIFQFALATVDTLRDFALDTIRDNKWPGYERMASSYRSRRFGQTMWHMDRELIEEAGFENVEILKGLFNRIPMILKEITSESDAKRSQFRSIGRVSDLADVRAQIESMKPIGRSVLGPVTSSANSSHS